MEELQTVEGLGNRAPNISRLSRNGQTLYARCAFERPFTDRERIGEYLVHWFSGKPRQTSCLLALDSEMFLKSIYREFGNRAEAAVRDARRGGICTSSGFPKMIIAHNHSDGRMIPSAEDRVISRTLSERLRGHGIELCAHYIVSGMDYTEFDF